MPATSPTTSPPSRPPLLPHKTNKLNRKVNRRTRKYPLTDAPLISPETVTTAIKKSRSSKAVGPDGMCSLHLKALGPHGINYLTAIFNLSLSTCTIPPHLENIHYHPPTQTRKA